METTIKKVLVPIDFSDYSKSALKYAVNFAKSFNAEIILVYVVEPVIYPPDFSMGQIAMPSITTEWDDRARDDLQKLAKSEINEIANVKTIIKTGKPFVEIIETAKEENIDLIIIATHGLSLIHIFHLISLSLLIHCIEDQNNLHLIFLNVRQ